MATFESIVSVANYGASFKHYLNFVAKLSKQTKLSNCPPLADGMKRFFRGRVLQQELFKICLLR